MVGIVLKFESILRGAAFVASGLTVVSVTGVYLGVHTATAALQTIQLRVVETATHVHESSMAKFYEVRGYVVAVSAIGPYATGKQRSVNRMLQRIAVDLMKEELATEWYPLESDMRDPRRLRDNGHSVAGAVRDDARRLINAAVDTAGMVRYEVSPGGHSHDENGIVLHFAPADLSKRVKVDEVKDNSAIIMIDTDYYLDNASDLLGYGRPMILFSFSPMSVSGKDGDCPFRVMKGNVVRYEVSGGSVWEHKLWNWCAPGEFVRAPARAKTFVGWSLMKLVGCFGLEKVVYHKVYHARPWVSCPDRVLVWTMPQASAWRFKHLPDEVNSRTLSRMVFEDPARPGWNVLESLDARKDVQISIGRAGEDLSMLMPKRHFDVLMGLQSTQSVSARMIGLGYKDPTELSLMPQYYRGAERDIYVHERVMAPVECVRVHMPLMSGADDLKVSFRAYAAPVVKDFNCVPMISRWDSMMRSIEVRVDMVRNLKEPGKQYYGFAAEFVRLVVPRPEAVVPYGWEETMKLLDKPSQVLGVKNILETVEMEPKELIESFVKNEPCMKNGRIISGFADMRFLVQYSRFTLAIRDRVLHANHNKHWFCPGSTPTELADKVVDYVSRIETPIESDYSNLDGTVSEWMQRNIGQAVYNRAVHMAFRDELNKLQSMEITCPARSKRFGFRYDPGVGVKSGSPTTCDKNTVYNAFVMYCAVRITCPELKPEYAYRMIGLCFGDDALFEDQFSRGLNIVAKQLGLTIKVERYNAENGLCFLARVFPDPYNTNTTFQDPLRTWRKLHLTARDVNIPIATAAIDRLEGYLVTDKLTPVTADYAAAVIRIYKDEVDKDLNREKRASRYKEKSYWLTGEGTWPQKESDRELMMRVISNRTGISVEVLNAYIASIQQVTNVWQLGVMDRNNDAYPYEETFDADGYAGEGGKDIDLINNQRDEQHRRLRENLTGTDRGRRGRDRRSNDRRPTPNRRESGGHRKLSGVSPSGESESPKRGNSATGETRPKREAAPKPTGSDHRDQAGRKAGGTWHKAGRGSGSWRGPGRGRGRGGGRISEPVNTGTFKKQ
ncbi:capsid protein [Erysiphe necator associated noda-like virus 1]|nr:capsid protein [Erysiphe necator associated noda-like virus 1]